jgi:hypothetical protein
MEQYGMDVFIEEADRKYAWRARLPHKKGRD